ncbi:hypothetical protein QVD17_05842 [Tagetes erecta]|uniref:Uncharacterized protein n=1 Tax=Tagetes erecta TaxID=13708 RepID=A0AAD8LEK7_TARER|nr:hypothetical protein QVD17_05842 [Tagetes erecta]
MTFLPEFAHIWLKPTAQAKINTTSYSFLSRLLSDWSVCLLPSLPANPLPHDLRSISVQYHRRRLVAR